MVRAFGEEYERDGRNVLGMESFPNFSGNAFDVGVGEFSKVVWCEITCVRVEYLECLQHTMYVRSGLLVSRDKTYLSSRLHLFHEVFNADVRNTAQHLFGLVRIFEQPAL